MPAIGDPALSATDAHLEHIILGTRGTTAEAEAFHFLVPEQHVSAARRQLIDGTLGDLSFHTIVYTYGAAFVVATVLATGWQPPKRI